MGIVALYSNWLLCPHAILECWLESRLLHFGLVYMPGKEQMMPHILEFPATHVEYANGVSASGFSSIQLQLLWPFGLYERALPLGPSPSLCFLNTCIHISSKNSISNKILLRTDVKSGSFQIKVERPS